MDECCPDSVVSGVGDKAMARRINDSVMEKIGAAQPKPKRVKRTLRTFLLVAAIAALMSTAAYAAGGFFMKLRKTDEPERGKWVELAADGTVLNEQKIVFPDAGMVLSFEGPKEVSNEPEFRCWYLPSEATFGFTDEEGWATYLSDNGEGPDIPYIVSCGNARPGNFRKVINGEVTLVAEDDWGDWHVTELTSDYTNCSTRWVYERANYVLLFNAEKGWTVSVIGTEPIEVLEHIARELEIRDSGRRPFYEEQGTDYVEGIGMIDPGRG